MTERLSQRAYHQIIARSGQAGRSKYRNKRLVTAEGRFDSELELDRWLELKTLERAGLISDLERQKSYRLAIGDSLICVYVADFVYRRDGALIVEDAKGVQTPVYRLKKKLMAAIHGIAVSEYPPKQPHRKAKGKHS